MAIRLLPYRQYNESDVFNQYMLATNHAGLEDPSINGDNDAGVVVYVSLGNLNDDTIQISETATHDPRKQHASPIGRNGMPYVAGQVAPTALIGDRPIGITLNQTLKFDENGEPLLYNPTKQAELQAVLPYQAVPVVSKGIFTLTEAAFKTTDLQVGDKLGYGFSTDKGKFTNFTGMPAFVVGNPRQDHVVGTVLGTGSRPAGDGYAGKYYMVQLDF